MTKTIRTVKAKVAEPARAPASTPVHRIPGSTTPTWEIELLISGVTVFAMLQLPGAIDQGYFGLENRLDRSWATALLMAYFYVKGSVVILAATFVVHLLMRAYWISLVGMASVYPDGIRWQTLPVGAIQRAIEKSLAPSMPDRIARADDRATLVFAMGVSLAGTFLIYTGFVAIALALSLALAQVPGIDRYHLLLVPGLFALLVAPLFFARALDGVLGTRLDPGRGFGRVLAAVFRVAYQGGIGRSSNPTFALVASHEGNHRARAFVTVIVLSVMVGIGWMYQLDRADRSAGNFEYVPTDSPGAARTLRAGHYDSLRDPASATPLPFIESEMSTGDYLRLAVPYRPNLHNRALRRTCPRGAFDEPKSSRARDRRRVELLQCHARIHRVEIDGQPVADLAYDFASDPKTGLPVIVALIDVRNLARGRHELAVQRPHAEADDHPRDYRIPFWR